MSGIARSQPRAAPRPHAARVMFCGCRRARARYCSTGTPACRPRRRQRSINNQVQRGDTISGIALAFGVTTRVIAAANSLRNPNFIRPRQVLHIPVAPRAKQASGSRGTYIVRRNDSLSSIASRHLVSLRDLMKWNGLKTTLIQTRSGVGAAPASLVPERCQAARPTRSSRAIRCGS